jgi:hypothetical protein
VPDPEASRPSRASRPVAGAADDPADDPAGDQAQKGQ